MAEISRPPLADIAPYPTRVEEATAAALIKRYAAFGEMHTRVGDEFGIDHDQWKTSIGHVVSSFTTVYLLAEIRDRLGVAVADEIARELWEQWEGGALPPWLWEWCEEEGLDHDAIAADADRVVANIRARQSGGESR